MKLAKKITSIASTVAILASFAALNVDAAGKNQYSVSYATLTQAVETADGTVIPAGAVAATVFVQGNTGFVANTLTLDIDGEYAVVTNADNRPVIAVGNACPNAALGSAIFGDSVCVTLATGDSCTNNGSIFTIYATNEANSTSEFVTINSVDPVDNITPASGMDDPNAAGTNVIVETDENYVYYYFLSGDADGNDTVNAVDASTILSVVNNVPGHELVVSTYSFHDYFPHIFTRAQPDANQQGTINSTDAELILNYTAMVGLNPNYVDPFCAVKKLALMVPNI